MGMKKTTEREGKLTKEERRKIEDLDETLKKLSTKVYKKLTNPVVVVFFLFARPVLSY